MYYYTYFTLLTHDVTHKYCIPCYILPHTLYYAHYCTYCLQHHGVHKGYIFCTILIMRTCTYYVTYTLHAQYAKCSIYRILQYTLHYTLYTIHNIVHVITHIMHYILSTHIIWCITWCILSYTLYTVQHRQHGWHVTLPILLHLQLDCPSDAPWNLVGRPS